MSNPRRSKQPRAKQPHSCQAIPQELSGYHVRESRRAKRVSIKISTWGDVEVVVPPGFPANKLVDILNTRQGWIEKTKTRIQSERQAIADESEATHPTEILLRALDETWIVTYQCTDNYHVAIDVDADQQHLRVTGQIDQIPLCHQLLSRWVRDYARYRLTPLLQHVSTQIQLPFNKLAIRRQKTRWASCSNKHNINLNDKLLFLPTELVRYVLVHELCHTIHLNHSKQFWTLVQQKEPNYQIFDKALRTAWRYIPRWLEE